MRVLVAQVFNPNNDTYKDIELPASYEELEDCLQMLNADNEHCVVDLQYFLGDVSYLEQATIQSCSLYQMNYLATLLQDMNDYQKLQFSGIAQAERKEFSTINEVINYALNVPTLDCFHAPATSDSELADFYIDNELLPQLADLENLTDEQYEWFCSHLDLGKVGKEIREGEHGVFTTAGYFVKNEEIKQLYDGNPIVPKPCDYIFKLSIIPNQTDNEESLIELKLPASTADVQRILGEVGANSMNDCCFHNYESLVVSQLKDCYVGNDEFEQLNELAENINCMSTDEIVKYKAMLDAVQCQTIETAIAISEEMDGFTLDRDCTSPSDYVDKVFATLNLPMKEELDFYLSKDGYGKALMKNNGIDNTSYGMLNPDNGISLKEQLQVQENSMEMTMSM